MTQTSYFRCHFLQLPIGDGFCARMGPQIAHQSEGKTTSEFEIMEIVV